MYSTAHQQEKTHYHCFPHLLFRVSRHSRSGLSLEAAGATVQPRFQLNAFQLQSQPQRSPLGTIEDQMERGGYIKICVHLFLFTFLAVAS